MICATASKNGDLDATMWQQSCQRIEKNEALTAVTNYKHGAKVLESKCCFAVTARNLILTDPHLQ